MGAVSDVPWCDASWPIVQGCTPVSEACRHCYAKAMATRFRGHAGWPADGDPFRPMIHPERLDQPMRWRKPRSIFVSPLGDLFHPAIPTEFIVQVWLIMARCSRPRRVRYAQTKVNVYGPHRFFVLTKRIERMREVLSDPSFAAMITNLGYPYPLPNVMLMATVENRAAAEQRILDLLCTPAMLRGLSMEPLLGPVDLADVYLSGANCCIDALGGEWAPAQHPPTLNTLDLVIVGGENGAGARPMHPRWASDILKDCRSAGVPFYFKGWGSWVPDYYGPEGEHWLKITGLKKGKEIIFHSDEATGGKSHPVNMHRRRRGEVDEIEPEYRQFPEWRLDS